MSSQTSSDPEVSARQTSEQEPNTQSPCDTASEQLEELSLEDLKKACAVTKQANDAWRNRIELDMGIQDEERQLKKIKLLFPDDPISKHQIDEQERKRKRGIDEQIATVTENRKRLCDMFEKTVEIAIQHEETMRDHLKMIRINQKALAKQSKFNQKLIDLLKRQQNENTALLDALKKQ